MYNFVRVNSKEREINKVVSPYIQHDLCLLKCQVIEIIRSKCKEMI